MVTLVKECTCVNMEEEEEQKRIIPQQNRTRFAESTLIDKRRSSLPDERSPSYPKPKPVYKRSATWSSRAFQRRASYLESRRFSAAIHTPSLKGVAERGNWGSKWEFLLSCVGLSVGIGNVWRFPYLAYENGGGAFLIPYLIMLVLAGKPMYFLELAFGQFAGLGPLAIWSCAPIAKGVGYAMVTVSLVVCIYYNVIMSYTIFYISASFQSIVPWSICDPSWADMETCYVRGSSNGAALNSTNITSVTNVTNVATNKTLQMQTSSQQYWERYVLEITPGIESSGGIKWDLALCLLFSWIVVVLCLMKGIKTSGKVVYFAATFPYVILIMLLINGLLLDGAFAGVMYFITPKWGKLLDIKVWQAAAGQMFFSLSVSMGGLIMYSSYNDFKNNIYRDAMVVSILDTVTSLISGTVIFSVLGAMSHELNIPIDKVVASGPGLAFVTYPEALSRLPVPQLWSVLFFLMLFILGLDSENVTKRVIVHTHPNIMWQSMWRKKGKKAFQVTVNHTLADHLRRRAPSFQFDKHCLVCGEECLQKDAKHPDMWKRVIQCKTSHRSGIKPFKDVLLDICEQRNDELGRKIELPIKGALTDLLAADAQYHKQCCGEFKRIPEYTELSCNADIDDDALLSLIRCLIRVSGQYVLELMDKYGGGTAVVFIAIAECISVIWIYGKKYNYEDDIIVNFFTLGLKRFCNDIYFMLGIKPGMYWKVAWLFFAPIILSLIFIYSMVSHEPLKYGDYDYPGWADGLGWILALVSMLQVPIWAIIMVLRQDAPTLRQKLFMAMQPTDEWGPSDSSLKEDWLAMQSRSDSVMLDEIKSEKPETKETASSQNGSVENPAYEGK
ncbi:Sodium- and chloride-dependent glycine transporter 2 [Nymphon striatum]|nr:Sodium- and chloride-dependent glycine transporter 2 [Nymphon striatum]